MDFFANLTIELEGLKSYGPTLIVTSHLNVLLFVYLIKVLYDVAIRERRGCGPMEHKL